jgi:hypothetical protein
MPWQATGMDGGLKARGGANSRCLKLVEATKHESPSQKSNQDVYASCLHAHFFPRGCQVGSTAVEQVSCRVWPIV